MVWSKTLDETCSTTGTGHADYSIDSRATIVGAVPNHFNGTVGTTEITITLGYYSRSIELHNTHDTQTLYISFDDGTNWFSIPPNGDWSKDIKVNSIKLKGSASGTTYEMIIGE